MWLIDDFRDFDYISRSLFNNYEVMGSLFHYQLRRSTDESSMFYGLYDGDRLVGYNWLMKFDNQTHSLYRGHEFHIVEYLKGRGLGTSLYLTILKLENIILVSDVTHTVPTGRIWQKLMKNPSVEVGTYNSATEQLNFILDIDTLTIYGNSHMHFAVRNK